MGLFDNPNDRGPTLLLVVSVVLGLAWIFILLRAYVRVYMIKNISSDDWWMFASMIVYTGYSIDAIIGILRGGTGKHVTELTLEETYLGLKTWYVSEIMYAPLSAMVRTSVALFLLRVATNPVHRWIVLIDLAVVWIVSVVFLFIVLFQCSPPSYFYDQIFGAEGHCMNINVVPNATIAHSVIGAACDLVFAGLPVAMLWNVQLNKRTKTVIALLLGMGAVAGIALLVRIPFVKVLAISPDFLYETIDVAIWSVLEPSLGIIAGCVATLRPLFKDLGFGRRSTINYNYGSHALRYRRTPGGGGGSSRRSWFSRKSSYIQKLGDGPMNTHDSSALVDSAKIAARLQQGKQSPASSNDTETIYSDIEMQLKSPSSPMRNIATIPPRAVISTNVGANPWAEISEGRGIRVQTSFHTESQPRVLSEV